MDDPLMDAYDRTRQRIDEIVSDVPDADGTEVVACPGWTVQHVVAHLAGLAQNVIDEDTAHYSEPEWTDAQVAARRDLPVRAVLREWADAMPQLRVAPIPPQTTAFQTLGRLIFMDAAVHEHDLRGSLHRPDPDNEAARLGLDAYIYMLGRILRRSQEAGTLPALRIVATDGGSWRLGEADDEVTVEASTFELWRGLSGRRSRAQVQGLRWSGDPSQVQGLRWSGDPDAFLAKWTLRPMAFSQEPLAY